MQTMLKLTIDLLKCALMNTKAEVPKDVDYNTLYDFATDHRIENIVFIALKQCNADIPDDIYNKFVKKYKIALMMEASQSYELETIGAELDALGIDYVPLKGSVVKYMYPTPDMRKSGDIDILIHPEDEPAVKDVLLKLDYVCNEGYEEHEVHSSYAKNAYLEVELHRRLGKYSDRSAAFCEKVWDYVYKEDGSHCCKMSNEYLYMYLVAHICKHLVEGGAGIRLITDLYVIKNKVQLDCDKLTQYLKKANLYDLNCYLDKIIDKWFNNAETDDKDVLYLEEIIVTGGIFGSSEMKQTIYDNSGEAYKYKLLIKRFFPPVRILKGRYSFLEKAPFLLPIMWLYRIFDIGIFERRTIKSKIEETMGNSGNNEKLNNIIKAIRDK